MSSPLHFFFVVLTCLGASLLPARGLSAGEKKKATFEALEAEIKAITPEKVAWREIKWKTSFVEGLKESRQTNKPLILWVFIDRPFDDERC